MPVRGHMCCQGLGGEGRKWPNKKVPKETDALPGSAGLTLFEGGGGTEVGWQKTISSRLPVA